MHLELQFAIYHITSHLLCWALGGGATNSPSYVLYMGVSYSRWCAHGTLHSIHSLIYHHKSDTIAHHTNLLKVILMSLLLFVV